MNSTSSSRFRLKVQQVGQICLFELAWGEGLQLTAQLPYSLRLQDQYAAWQRAYLNFYKTASISMSQRQPSPDPSSSHQGHDSTQLSGDGSGHDGVNASENSAGNQPYPDSNSDAGLRGRTVNSGQSMPSRQDWHAQLSQSETRLLYEFQTWLRSAELYDIRAAIAQVSQQQVSQGDEGRITVFLTCTPLELARLPWEAWELGTEFAATGSIQIVRSPANIRSASSTGRGQRRRPRILAVLGDDTGLNFQADRVAVRSLSRLAEIEFVGWQPGRSATEVNDQITRAIADETGWDVLFFAGHSNETQMTGGELAIAPGASVSIKDLASSLIRAQQRGLKFALFNSCSGLNIAESLINLGFSQVAIMREPIHNRVAQDFLVRFLQALAEHHDVQDAMTLASQALKTETSFSFPSAYLVPSLFCHPGAVPFRIPPRGWRQQLQRVIPRRYEAIALTACVALTWISPVQTHLLNQRLLAQAIYRHVTGQIPAATEPPVVLLQIDERSVRLSGMEHPHPLDRRYLARILDALVEHNAQVVGVDYLLDRQQPENDPILAQSVRRAIAQQTWLVFGGLYSPRGETSVGEATGIADLRWSLHGYLESFPWSIAMLYPGEHCNQVCPFSYLLSLIHVARMEIPPDRMLQPDLTQTENLRDQLINLLEQESSSSPYLATLARDRWIPLTIWAEKTVQQFWFMPIVDYSIPPEQVYERVPAWMLLDDIAPFDDLDLSDRIVLIGSGYAEAGIGESADYFDIPPALQYWRDRTPEAIAKVNARSSPPKWTTGAEVHAYTIHHFLNRRLVRTVPALWLIGLAAVLGMVLARGLNTRFRRHWTRSHRRILWLSLITGTGLYGWAALQLYLSASIVLPWLLPSIVFWAYLLPPLRRKTNDS